MQISGNIRTFARTRVAIGIFLSGCASLPAQQLTRGPYLQVGTPSSVVIRWRTDSPSSSRVVYGTDFSNLEQSASDTQLTTEHVVPVSGLQPATRYFYSIGTTTSMLTAPATNQYFHTAPIPGTPGSYRFWAIGDAGIGTADQVAVKNAFQQLIGTNHVDGWLTLGDNVYWSGLDAEFQSYWFNIYPSLLRRTVLWPALGNHDTAQSTAHTTNYPYFTIFSLPADGQAGGIPSRTPHYYSFDYGNVHFVCLDSTTADRSSNGPMAAWLRSDLQANSNQWTVAYWHHPPYTKGSHDSDGLEIELLEMRQIITPILETYGVDLVLCGHSHSYERSYLLNGHYGYSSSLQPGMILNSGNGDINGTGPYLKPLGCRASNYGTVYAVVGCSGWLGGGLLNHPVMCVSSNVLGSLVLSVNSNRLDAIFLRDTGQTNDQFTIIKTNFAPAAFNKAFIIPANAPAPLKFAGGDPDGDPAQFVINSSPTQGLVSELNPATGEFTYTPARGFQSGDTFYFSVVGSGITSAPANVSITVTAPLDTNQNNLPDDWEARFNVTDPAGDEDKDGMNNLHEYRANTHPRDVQSWLRITSIEPGTNAGFVLNWPAVAGVRYRLHYSNGGPGGVFTSDFVPFVRPVLAEMAPGQPGASVVMTASDDFSISGVPPHGARFYRLEVITGP